MRYLLFLLLFTPFGVNASEETIFDIPLATLNVPLTQSGSINACLASDGCVLDCGVGLNTGADLWECQDGTSTAVAVTQGTGSTYDNTGFSSVRASTNITDAKAPRLTNPTLLGNLWATDHTIIAIGQSAAGAGNGDHYFSNGETAADGFQLLRATGQVRCGWYANPATQNVNTSIEPINQWMIASCRRSASNYIARGNGIQTSAAIITTAAAPTTRQVYFGRAETAGGNFGGPLARIRIYTRALSDAEIAQIEAQWWGITAENRNVTVTRASTAWTKDNTNLVYSVGNGAGRTTTQGLLVEEVRTNVALHSLQMDNGASWVVQNVPIITANAKSGPFSRLNGGAEMERINDDSAAAFKGIESTGGTTAGTWTFSAYLAADTINTAILLINHNGDGPTVSQTACTFQALNTSNPTCANQAGHTCAIISTNLGPSNDVHHVSCTATVTGAPTFVKGQIRPGNASGDVGSIFATGGQLELGAGASSPIVTTTTTLQRIADVATVSTTGWPVTQGCVSFVYRPSTNVTAERWLLSTGNGSGHGWSVAITSSSQLQFISTTSGGSNSYVSGSLTWINTTDYRIRACWTPGGSITLDRNGVRELTTSLTRIPTTIHTSAHIGAAYNGQLQARGWIRNIEVRH